MRLVHLENKYSVLRGFQMKFPAWINTAWIVTTQHHHGLMPMTPITSAALRNRLVAGMEAES